MSSIAKRVAAAAGLAGLCVMSASVAQTASQQAGAGTGIEEVIVTAQRREERLQDVPISVTAFSQEKLDSQGLKSIDDLTRLTPGVNFQRNAPDYLNGSVIVLDGGAG